MNRGGLLLAGLVAAGLLLAQDAGAATFTVTSTGDPTPNGCGQGGCSLREAAIAANNRAGADVILLRSRRAYQLGIAGADEEQAATGDIDLTGPTTVRATGRRPATVDAAELDRAFDVRSRATFVSIKVVGGVTQPVPGEEQGGAIRSESGRLVLRRCQLVGIEAPPLGGANAAVQKPEGAGGAIVIERTTVSGTDGGALVSRGGGDIQVERSRLLNNADGGVLSFGDGGVRVANSVIDGNGGDGVEDREAGGVRVTRSRITDNDGQGVSDFDGGGVRVQDSRVLRSDAQGVQDFDDGGVSVIDSRVGPSGSQGVQDFGNGGVAVIDSAVIGSDNQGVQNFDPGDLVLRDSRVIGSPDQAVAQFENGALRISRSTVSGGENGGVFVDVEALPSKIVASTISGNTTSGDGGGIRNDATLVVRNSTVAGNRADGNGGGIANSGTLRLNNVTVARNTADADNDTSGSGGGLFNGLLLSSIQIANSVVALNDMVGGDADDCFGGFDSTGGNLRSDGTECDGFDRPGDRVRQNPKLGPLKRNGGKTKTIALKRGSPAVGNARKGSAEKRDQRGRKRDGDPDAGAFER